MLDDFTGRKGIAIVTGGSGGIGAAICRRLGVRSIVAAPIRYEREVVGLAEVFSPQSFAFDEGDVSVLERLAQTVLLTLSQAQLFKRS